MIHLTLKYLAIFIFSVFLFNCSAESSKPLIVTTSFPAASIIKELVGNRVEVEILVPAGASPHTYAPKPSDIKKSSIAIAFISLAQNSDGWSKEIKSKRHIELIKFLPDSLKVFFDTPHVHDHEGHNHEGHNHDSEEVDSSYKDNLLDPHFWFDPFAVKAILSPLSDSLASIMPEHADAIKKNAELFSKRLDLIHKEVSSISKGLFAKPLFLQHPSFLYFAKRYNLEYKGSIEEIPGKEPSPKYIAELVRKIKESGATAIFTEPQLNKKAGEIIAKEAGVLLFEIDPVGGTDKIKNYSDLMLVNAKIIVNALGK